VVAGALADVALWWLAPVPDPYQQFEKLRPQVNQYIRFEYPRGYSATTVVTEELPGMEKRSRRFTANNLGFRGQPLETPKPAEEFRVFVVGGSTTECFYLDDEEELGAVAERALDAAGPQGLDVAVYNVGLSGAASDDHVAMISQRLVHLEPDMVVVFCGINDLTRSIYRYDYRHYVKPRPAYRKPWLKRLVLKSQIARRLYFLKRRVDPSDSDLLEHRRLESGYVHKIGLQRTIAPSDVPPRTDVPSYTRNLESIAGLAEAHGFQLVFMTQQTTWNSLVDADAGKWHWMRCRGGVTYREDLMDAALESLNDAMRGVADAYGVPLYDLVRVLPKSLDYFYDDCHFNTRGAHTVGNLLAEFLIENSLIVANAGSRE
jgi:lysophospholipase L1-like esterase